MSRKTVLLVPEIFKHYEVVYIATPPSAGVKLSEVEIPDPPDGTLKEYLNAGDIEFAQRRIAD